MKTLLNITASILILCSAQLTFAGEHAHFAAFFDPSEKAVFPDEIKGDDIEGPLTKIGAQMLIFAHSAGVKNGDVWSLQNNTLRNVNDSLVDLGVGCQITMKLSPYQVSGICSVFMNAGAGQEKATNIIRVSDIQSMLVWHKIFEDKEHHIAGYFMRETAVDFNH